MSSLVIDTSAVLATLFDEAGGDWPDLIAEELLISSVNVEEAISKLVDKGDEPARARERLAELGMTEIAFDHRQSRASGDLRPLTRAQGLSLGDRACLALARVEGLPVITADRPWAALDVGVVVRLIR